MDIRTVAFILCTLLEITNTHGAALPCGGVLNEPKGEFFSPNYPNSYPNKAHCTWSIQSTGDRIIELSFPFVNVEYVNWDADCRFDSISVYDGPVSDDRLLSRICGNQTRVFNSTRNELTVVFTSDSTFPYKGFHASYSFVDVPVLPDYPTTEVIRPTPDPKDMKCGGELTEPKGEFFSPNYPKNYPIKAKCTWSIKSTGNRIIGLTFPVVNLETDWLKDCRFDSVRVYDGPASDDRLLGRLCGTQNGHFNSTRNELTVVFSSDSSTTFSGFKAEYGFIDVPSLSEYPTPVPTEDPAEMCGSVLEEPKGEFFSPNYPGSYPNKANCTWSIQSTGDRIIELSFPFMQVEYRNWDADCRFDAISVYDGPVSDDRLLHRLCGNQTLSIKSTKNEMTVLFTSDSTFPYKGFHASYSFVDKA
ncbi:deleted in malignant brain tumors 1 protein-like [Clupea harengus]|uniref:Deleted in malignant brain tumors 1 protein-like n=1 Tax=Clupea harengus TaxID=7950 RepID=A0A6P8FQZ2_CLUHA|nr:deleted in malignant brain tumors 1 protein-like [Clupea harengus]